MNGITTGTYTYGPTNGDSIYCKLTTNNACQTVSTVTSNVIKLNIVDNPVIPAIVKTGNTSLCYRDSLVLTNNATGILQWLRNNNPIKNAITGRYVVRGGGVYTLKVTNASGCFALSADSVVATVIAVPVPVISLVDDTLVSSSTVNNQWYFSNTAIPGATSQKYNPSDIGYYAVQVGTGNCSAMSADYFYTANTLKGKDTGAIHLKSGTSYLKLYPNPTAGNAYLQIGGTKELVQIKLTNLSGETLWQTGKQSDGMVVIPTQSLPSGIYLVTITDGVHVKTMKLIKAK